jgi:hypothetical protein
MASGAIGGSTPQLNRGPEVPGYKALYFSIREIALIKDKTCQPGYGVLRAGTIMAENISALTTGGKGMLVPYVLAAYTEGDVGRALSLTDIPSTGGAGEKTINVLMGDSYKFKVGDDLIVANDSPAIHEGGAISAIDRTTHPHYATITFTTGIVSDATYTIANNCCCYVEAGITPFSIAKYILDKDVDTGVGEIAKGAITPVLLSNAILYTNSLINFDAAAATSLGTVDDGQHTILK